MAFLLSVFATHSPFTPKTSALAASLSIRSFGPTKCPGNQRSILGMAVWPTSAFTYGIYRMDKPPWTLHLAALFHVSVGFRIGTRNGAASW